MHGTVDNPSKNALSLLIICRDIYLETRLLPFVYHTFSASHWLGIAHFMKGRSVKERNAVAMIEIRFRFPIRYYETRLRQDGPWLLSKEMAFPWLDRVECIRLVGRTGERRDSDDMAFEVIKCVIVSARKGVEVEIEYEVGPMLWFMVGR
jgi:hypothetical protein